MLDHDVVYYDFDNFRLDIEKQQLLKNGEPVLLTYKAFQTLHILVQNCGQIVEKENIYNSIWTDSFVEDGNLTQYIYLLRKILDKSPDGEPYIETVARRGYVFTAQVRRTLTPADSFSREIERSYTNGNSLHRENSDSLRSPVTGLEQVPNSPWISPSDTVEFPDLIDTSDPPHSGLQYRVPRFAVRKSNWIRVVTVLLLIGSVSFIAYKYFGIGRSAAGNPAAINSIAVLPFKPIGDNSRDLKLGFGMADAIITRLSNLQQIPVRPTSSVFKYVDEPSISFLEAGKDLGVDAILEGTVQMEGERVRVSVQLYNVATGDPVWADKFDEKYIDVFSLQDSIANKVAGSITSKLTARQLKSLEQHITSNSEALQAYQMGIYFWNTRTKDDLERAATSFLRAIEIDPDFAKAYAMLADTYNMIGYYGYADRIEMRSRSTAAAAKALMLDNSIAEAHIANAFIQFTPPSVEAANMSIERAIELAPYNATARLRHSWILLRLGRLEDAVSEMRLAQEYDPLSAISNNALCSMLTYSGKYAEAVTYGRRAVELTVKGPAHRLGLANALFFNGETEEAIALARLDIEEGNRKFAALGNLGFYFAKLGQKSEAEAVLKQLRPESKNDSTLLVDLTLIEHALGDRDRSFAHFRQAYEKRVLQIGPMRVDPVWKDVLADERFAQLISD